jgi:hypothetical protein
VPTASIRTSLQEREDCPVRITLVLITIIVACLVISTANAQRAAAHHHPSIAARSPIVCDQQGCSDRVGPGARLPGTGRDANPVARVLDANGNNGVIGGRPSGCPYEFCGCEASRYVFGEIRRELNLASNWLRAFPRATAGAGMAAVRNHHVMILMSHVSGRDWLVHDGNSGNHLTHEHVRSIAGYVIVDPHGALTASTAQ